MRGFLLSGSALVGLLVVTAMISPPTPLPGGTNMGLMKKPTKDRFGAYYLRKAVPENPKTELARGLKQSNLLLKMISS